jgi:hypothetical protein
VDACHELGVEIGRRGHGLVFGGSARGLMGATATGVSSEGGEILGIAPRFYDEEGEFYSGCTDFIYTETMSERKDLFQINADAFVILPGGIGTFDEFFETVVYKELGQLDKPVVLFNVNGYFDKLEEFMQVAIAQQFVRVHESELYDMASDVQTVLDIIEKAER